MDFVAEQAKSKSEVGWELGWGFNIWLPCTRYKKQKGLMQSSQLLEYFKSLKKRKGRTQRTL